MASSGLVFSEVSALRDFLDTSRMRVLLETLFGAVRRRVTLETSWNILGAECFGGLLGRDLLGECALKYFLGGFSEASGLRE